MESRAVRPRQARYQAALRPDMKCSPIIKHFQTRLLLQLANSASNFARASLHWSSMLTTESCPEAIEPPFSSSGEIPVKKGEALAEQILGQLRGSARSQLHAIIARVFFARFLSGLAPPN